MLNYHMILRKVLHKYLRESLISTAFPEQAFCGEIKAYPDLTPKLKGAVGLPNLRLQRYFCST